ncbi:hypothetical protein [Larkinella soli]|uniref:hypothetical protein n=1 Tax=Larkinella soli TaxID=1770527 RepID=UPI000FFBF587|nr:hypothetical protein [Larkinella soli]
MTDRKIAVAQLGARMHYAVPRILHENGLLQTLYTDFYSRKYPFALLQKAPFFSTVKRLNTRHHPGLPAGRVCHFPPFGLRYSLGRSRCLTSEDRIRRHLEGGLEFSRLVLKQIRKNLPDVVYTFNSAALEIMEFAKANGIFIVHEQTICLHYIEKQLLKIEKEKFPEWAINQEFTLNSNRYADRERNEFLLADRVVCGSEFVKGGLIAQSVGEEKVQVIPYGVAQGPLGSHPVQKKAEGN